MPKNLILKNVYRNGRTVKMAFRDGELIYQMVTRLVFNVDTNSLYFDPTGETKTITITANDDWTMTVPEWITASSLSGYTGATISLTAGSTESGRTGNIVITCGGKSHTVSVDQVLDYSKMYLTIEAQEAGTFTINKAVGYSLNGGAWATSSEGQELSLQTGDRIRFKFTATGYQLNNLFKYNTLSCKAYGNVLSLTSGDNYESSTSIIASGLCNSFDFFSGLTDASNLVFPATSLNQDCYRGMFNGCINMVTGPKILPATTLATRCYRSMFQGCNKLLRGPDLPATTLVNGCYYNMFGDARILNYVKCLASNISATESHTQWMLNVQTASGTFVKNPNISTSTWGSGISGIPSNWTVEDATT